MSNKIKEFHNRRGNVYVAFDGFSYSVQYTRYSNSKTGRPETITEYLGLDSVIANEYFDAAKNELKGGPWIDPALACGYLEKYARVCSRDMCPKKLGGAAYWDIFRASCPYRRR